MHLFLADRLTARCGTQDEDEEIEIHDFSVEEIGRMIKRGAIEDAKTILGYYLIRC